MGTSRTVTERQLSDARNALKLHSDKLVGQGIVKENFSRDTKWRQIDAQIRQISKRLIKIGEVEALDAELQQRKSEVAAAE